MIKDDWHGLYQLPRGLLTLLLFFVEFFASFDREKTSHLCYSEPLPNSSVIGFLSFKQTAFDPIRATDIDTIYKLIANMQNMMDGLLVILHFFNNISVIPG